MAGSSAASYLEGLRRPAKATGGAALLDVLDRLLIRDVYEIDAMVSEFER
jgi:hypothetical protein